MSDEQSMYNIPKFQNQQKQISDYKALLPVLSVFGMSREEIEKLASQLDATEREYMKLIASIVEFNEKFASLGWIAHENMKVEIIESAVREANKEHFDKAEDILLEYYNPQTLRTLLHRMNQIKKCKPRMRLLLLALEDYQEERYHACIPVVLAQIDGLVNDLHEKNKGIWSEGVDLEAWDSLSANKFGLKIIADYFKTTRKKTRSETITLPYRHGIIHGRDLGYDNKLVAAKTWAMLIALSDWAFKAEDGKLNPPTEKPKKGIIESIKDLAKQSREIRANKELRKEWLPREIIVGKDVPISAEPEQYAENSPERKVAEYFHYWKQRNYGYMSKCIHYGTKKEVRPSPGIVREAFEHKEFVSFSIQSIKDAIPELTRIEVNVEFKRNNQIESKSIQFNMSYYNDEGTIEIRTKGNGSWFIPNWRIN